YFDQQDYIAKRQEGKTWTWSTLRPHGVYGFSVGYPHNIMMVLAVFATISKELGLPLRFPGKSGCFAALSQATDVELLAKAMLWLATTPACANQAFNIGNGDNFRWQNVWPKIADFFSMEPGPVQEIRMADNMPQMASIWDAIAARHGLNSYSFQEMANWA